MYTHCTYLSHFEPEVGKAYENIFHLPILKSIAERKQKACVERKLTGTDNRLKQEIAKLDREGRL